MKKEIEKKLNKILKKFNLEKIPEKANFIKNGSIDSISFIKIISEIEKNFQIKIPTNLLFSESISTVASIKKLIIKSLKN